MEYSGNDCSVFCVREYIEVQDSIYVAISQIYFMGNKIKSRY